MIYIIDDFLNQEYFDSIVNELKDFKKIDMPGKSFWVKRAHDDFINYMTRRLSATEGHEVEVILGFFRQAQLNEDNEWRIHNDSIIEGQQPDRAAVLYMSENSTNELNGTAFWEHKELGDTYTGTSAEEFDKLLNEDSNNLSKWLLKSVVGHKANRLVSYPCEYFHSKYPSVFIKPRKVFVIFYKIKKNDIK